MSLTVNGIPLDAEKVIITSNGIIPDDFLSLKRPVYEYELEFELSSPIIGTTIDVSQEMMDKLIRPLQTRAQITVTGDDKDRTFIIYRRDYKRNRIHLSEARNET